MIRPEAHAAGQAPAPTSGKEAARLSEEDREVVENLELLERLDEAEALDVLLELSEGAETEEVE
ncbi:MAG: hypothetical protein L0Y66_05855 [Myxococcaceae bacterium]|nr:hypothetical protein [Myxococcaceae bacterium]MCI0670988.1 hypothetical protein [Myxococcaceae bacterium]